MESILCELDKEYTVDFFYNFIHSKYLIDKKAALRVIHNTDMNLVNGPLDIVLQEFDLGNYIITNIREGNNLKYLYYLINIKYEHILIENISDIWALNLRPGQKRKIVEILAPKYYSELLFLKENNYQLHLYNLLVNEKISHVEAFSLLENIDPQNRHFALFELSKELSYKEVNEEIQKLFQIYSQKQM